MCNMDLKNELLNILEVMVEPFNGVLCEDEQYVSKYDDNAMKLEKFSRSLLGYGPLLYNKPNSEVLRQILFCISEGVNPKSANFWGTTKKMDQRHVEMFSILFFLYNLREQIDEDFFRQNRNNLLSWFSNINHVKLPNNNWLFFGLLVNVLLYKLGIKDMDWEKIRQLQLEIDSLYISDGIYQDGQDSQVDYYNSFSLHFYGLIYVKLMNAEDKKICDVYVDRYKLFINKFRTFFSYTGDSIPYGRSLVYRFGVCASISAAIYAEIRTEYEDSIVIYKNVKWWLDKDIFDTNGFLNLGYTYRNHKILEDYSSYGSPYWAFKAFVGLYSKKGFDISEGDNSFKKSVDLKITFSKFILQSSNGNRYFYPVILSTGFSNSISHYNEKYLKFCYTNLFGFNVDGDASKVNDVALDSSLSILEGNVEFHDRIDVKSILLSENIYKTCFKLGNDYTISSTIICFSPWHVRVHVIDSPNDAIFREGGFPVNLSDDITEEKNNSMLEISNSKQRVAIAPLYGGCIVSSMSLSPNTNVLYRKTVIPVAQCALKKGKNIIINAFYGDVNVKEDISVPRVEFEKNRVKIYADIEKFEVDIPQYKRKNNNYLMKSILAAKNIYKYVRDNKL